MLAQRYRFHGYNSLRYVYKHGDAVRSQFVTIKSSQNPRRKAPRVAVVVSKKIWKRAVKRNYIRRRLYEIVRQEMPLFRDGQDIVCIVSSPDVYTVSSRELSIHMHEMFVSANLYKTDAKSGIIE